MPVIDPDGPEDPSLGLWICHLTSLSFCCLTCKVKIMTLQSCCEEMQVKEQSSVLGS